MTQRALISGGGIGGLTAALCFQHMGWDAVIFEQASAIEEVGAGLQLSPNAMAVYRALGLEAALTEAAFTPEGISLRMGESGHRLMDMPLGDAAVRRWGAPYLHIHRADCIAVLERAAAGRLLGRLHLSKTVTGYTAQADSVKVHFSDGTSDTGDVLVGADGIHSTIRAQMLGPDQPTFTGNLAWRAVVDIDALGDDAPEPVVTAWMGRGRHAVTYRVRGGRLANFVGVVESDRWQSETWTEEGARAEALNDFSGWHPTLTRMIQEAPALFQWALYDRPPLRTWTDGRVALLGDAAHPMLPFMAQGAAMAIEDAFALAKKVTTTTDIAAGLGAYERLRHGRASRVQAQSRANARTFHQETDFGRLKTYGPMWLAGRVAPTIGLRRQDWVYGYDITQMA